MWWCTTTYYVSIISMCRGDCIAYNNIFILLIQMCDTYNKTIMIFVFSYYYHQNSPFREKKGSTTGGTEEEEEKTGKEEKKAAVEKRRQKKKKNVDEYI